MKQWAVPMADRLSELTLIPYQSLAGVNPKEAWECQRREFEQLKTIRSECQVVSADEVAEWVWAVDPREYWSDDDLDCLIPPFPATWLEYRSPSRINSEGTIRNINPGGPRRTAVVLELRSIDHAVRAMREVDVEEHLHRATWMFHNQMQGLLKDRDHVAQLTGAVRKAGTITDLGQNDRQQMAMLKIYIECCDQKSWAPFHNYLRKIADNPEAMVAAAGIKWELWMIGLMELPDNRVIFLPVRATVNLNDQGQQIGSINSLHWGPSPPQGTEMDHEQLKGHGELMLFYRVALIAVTLSHFKNVVLHKQTPDPKFARAYQRRHDQKLSSQHVLEIPQLTHLFDGQGRLRHSLAERELALHRVRSHYKVYTEDRPLFGRITGSFLWMSHLRGKGDTPRETQYNVGLPAL